jgi:hypothetical protein
MSALGHKRTFLDVRFSLNDVRFTPESGRLRLRQECPLRPNGGHRSAACLFPLLYVQLPLLHA